MGTSCISPRVVRALVRAWLATTLPAKYILGEGGRSPLAKDCFTPDKNGNRGSDCIGFVMWCLQLDRYQPKTFRFYDGWMNTDSVMMDATSGGIFGEGHRIMWRKVTQPQAGDLVVFPSIHKNGKRVRVGHVGLVVEAPEIWPKLMNPDQRREMLKQVKVIDCNSGWLRKLKGKAIAEITAATLWDKPDAIFVRYIEAP